MSSLIRNLRLSLVTLEPFCVKTSAISSRSKHWHVIGKDHHHHPNPLSSQHVILFSMSSYCRLLSSRKFSSSSDKEDNKRDETPKTSEEAVPGSKSFPTIPVKETVVKGNLMIIFDDYSNDYSDLIAS